MMATLLFPAAAAANVNEYTAFQAKSAKYQTYYNSKSCGTCHGAGGYGVGFLKAYGGVLWNQLLTLGFSGSRTVAQNTQAMTDIEPLDADADGYTNISEINANSDASSFAVHPTASVALSASPTGKSGTPTTTVPYTVTVTNNGNLIDSFTIGVYIYGGQSWTTSFTGTANNVPIGGTANITVNVVVGSGATNGQTSVARVTAASQSNASISATPLDLTTTASVTATGTRYVNAGTGVDTGNCATAGSPCKTITYAMSQATVGNPGDLVSVAPGTYNLALGEIFPINMKSGVRLKATGTAANTIIDAIGDTVRDGVLKSNLNTSTFTLIEGFTIQNGLELPPDQGGSATGGGIKILSGSGLVTITRNILSGNESRGYSADNSIGMTGGLGWGGGLYVFASTVNVTNNLFIGNIARGGNGFSHPASPPTGNENGGPGVGGAIYFFGTGNITNNTFYANTAIGGSGGLTSASPGDAGDASAGAVSSGVNIDNNIFVNNSTTAGAGGIATTGALSASGGGSLANNLFFGNTQNGAPSADTLGTGSLSSNPLFISAPSNLRIQNASPAKAAGITGASIPGTDFDGVTRPSPPAIGAFEPVAPAVLGVASSANVTASSVELNGNVTSDSGSAVTERGFVFSPTGTNANPVIGGPSVTKVSVSGTTGLFASGVTGLSAGTGYSFKAFATNGAGTAYSTVASFTTLLLPVATTGAATNLTQGSATLNGLVNPNGSNTAAGFQYGPTVSYGTQVTAAPSPGSGSAPVAVSATVTGLSCGATYNFRATATGAAGTANGSNQTFTTTACGPTINSFTASPVVVNPGQASTLSWSVAAGASVTLNGSPVSSPTGSTTVNPTSTTTYTLVATAGGGSTTRTVTVSVNDGGAALGTPSVTSPGNGQTVIVTGVGFTWTGVGGASGYDVRVVNSASGLVVFSGSLSGGGSTSTLISLPAGSYQFAVRACSGGFAASQCGGYGTVSFTVSPAAPAGAPSVTFPTQGATLTSSTQTLAWTAVTPNPALSGLTYEVLLRDLTAGTTALQITVPSPTLSTIFTMKSSTQYELKVRACQAGCGPYSTAVTFAVTLPPVPVSAPSGVSCSVSGGNSLTCSWNAVSNADAYQVQVVQAPPAGPGGGALTAAAKQVSATTVTLPVPSGAATVFITACNGDGCGPSVTTGINAAGPNASQASIGTPMAGTVVSGPGVLFTWNRVPGDNGSNTFYRLFVQDLSRQSTALDVYTTNNFYSAYFKAEGARYDALVVSNPGLGSQVIGPSQGFNVAGSSATSPTLVSPPHNSTVTGGNIELGWSPVPGATLYEYFVAVLGQGDATARGVTPGLLAQVPLSGSGGGTVYSGIVRACPAGATCVSGSDAGWGPWSNAPGGPGVTNFTVVP